MVEKVELSPGDQKIEREILLYEKNNELLNQNRQSWESRYRHKTLGLYHGKLVAVGDDNEDILEAIRDQQIPREYTLILRVGSPKTIEEAITPK